MINILSEKLIRNAHDLQDIGINEYAWNYSLVLEVISILRDKDYVILGGDVYEINGKNGKISPTADSWYFNKFDNKNDVIESYKEALNYIDNYHNRNGEKFYYSIVYEIYNM